MKIILEISTIVDAKAAIHLLSAMVERSRRESLPTEEVTIAPQDDVSVDALALTPRTVNCLKVGRIYTLSQLICWRKYDLLRIPNLGRKALNEIIERLEARELKLKA